MLTCEYCGACRRFTCDVVLVDVNYITTRLHDGSAGRYAVNERPTQVKYAAIVFPLPPSSTGTLAFQCRRGSKTNAFTPRPRPLEHSFYKSFALSLRQSTSLHFFFFLRFYGLQLYRCFFPLRERFRLFAPRSSHRFVAQTFCKTPPPFPPLPASVPPSTASTTTSRPFLFRAPRWARHRRNSKKWRKRERAAGAAAPYPTTL